MLTVNKKSTKTVRRKNSMTSLRRLSGMMYKNILRDVYALLSVRKKQKRRKRVLRTPVHRKEYYTSYSSESCASETELEIKNKKASKGANALQMRGNASLQALRRSNRILQRKLQRERHLSKQRRLFKKRVPAKKSNKNDEVQVQNTHTIQQTEETDGFSENMYETPQHSIDSGYSAHIIGESDGSEIIPAKPGKIANHRTENIQNETKTTKRRQTEVDDVADYKKKKLELFGSATDSDSSCDTQPSARRKAIKKKKLPRKCSVKVKEKPNSSVSFEEPLPPLEEDPNENDTAEEVAVFKKPSRAVKCSKKRLKSQLISKEIPFSDTVVCNVDKSDTVTNVNHLGNLQEIQTPTTSMKLPCDTSVKKSIKIVRKEFSEQVKTSFKRPNCRSRFPETPRSPEPSEVTIPSVQPKIIPLDKPKQLSTCKLQGLFFKVNIKCCVFCSCS